MSSSFANHVRLSLPFYLAYYNFLQHPLVLHIRILESYKKDTVIIEEGSQIHRFGVLLTGCGRSYKIDMEGNVITITLLREGSKIGVLLAASPEQKSPVSVIVEKRSIVLFISYNSLILSCSRNCPYHKLLIKNFIGIVAEKGLVLHERLDCLLRSSAQDKIMAYLKKFLYYPIAEFLLFHWTEMLWQNI